MYSSYVRLNVPVWASNIDVIRKARKRVLKKLRRAPEYRDARHRFYRNMLSEHENARAIVREWRL